MRETITTELLRRLQHAPPTAVLDIYDTKVPRLVLRVRPTGTHSYRLVLGRGRWYTLGSTDLIPSRAPKPRSGWATMPEALIHAWPNAPRVS